MHDRQAADRSARAPSVCAAIAAISQSMPVALHLVPLAFAAFSQPSRRHVCTAAAAAATAGLIQLPTTPSVAAATAQAIDLLAEVGDLSTRARILQYELREHGDRRRVVRERPKLEKLVVSMNAAAPELRICAPALADCDCTPDPELMHDASRQAAIAATALVDLDAELAKGERGVSPLVAEGSLIASYPGGALEAALEELCESADRFLDLAAGRPLMTARLAPLSTSATTAGVGTSLSPPQLLRPGVVRTLRAPAPQLMAAVVEPEALAWTVGLAAASYASGYATRRMRCDGEARATCWWRGSDNGRSCGGGQATSSSMATTTRRSAFANR